MFSDTMTQRLRAGEIRETAEIADWLFWLDVREVKMVQIAWPTIGLFMIPWGSHDSGSFCQAVQRNRPPEKRGRFLALYPH